MVDGPGPSFFLVRDGAGGIGAFRNSCRHRGNRLLDGEGRINAIPCPYHGWSYGLDGRAQHIPAPEGLRDTAKAGLHLQPLRHAEWAGLIWVSHSDATPPLTEALGPIIDELAPFALDEFEPIQHQTWRLPCNWKAAIENLTDFYHVPHVHRRTIAAHAPRGPDLHSYGDHTRQRLEIATYGWRAGLDRRCSRGGPYTPLQQSAMHKYLVFPSTILNVVPFHLTVMQVLPVSADSCDLVYAFCQRRGARGLERLRAVATWAASRVILREDLQLLARYQQGLHAAGPGHHHLHAMEAAAAHFHGTLQRYLSDDPAPWAAGPAGPVPQ